MSDNEAHSCHRGGDKRRSGLKRCHGAPGRPHSGHFAYGLTVAVEVSLVAGMSLLPAADTDTRLGQRDEQIPVGQRCASFVPSFGNCPSFDLD